MDFVHFNRGSVLNDLAIQKTALAKVLLPEFVFVSKMRIINWSDCEKGI